MNDNYDNIIETTNFMYTTESIPSSAIPDSLLEEFIGCDCTDCSTSESCECYKKSGINYINYKLTITDETKPAYECNSNCKCTNECNLKLIQNGPISGLKLINFLNKGNGLITETNIPKGAFICEYAGEYIVHTEAERRHKLYKNAMNYIFWLKEHFGDNIVNTIIDPTRIGNIGRFINHSCRPNCSLIPIRVANVIPKLCIFANRDIEEGEEVTFDYGCNESGLICDGGEMVECFCGVDDCKKFLPLHQA